MDSRGPSQLELFSRAGKASEPRPARGNSLIRRIRTYEKVILASIGFMIAGIVAFSLGVEKGKRLAQQAPPRHIAQEIKPRLSIPALDVTAPQKPPASLQNYTIQLASYANKAYAQKEADALKKRGLEPLILSKGSYVILCVGRFADKDNAKALLPDLQKQYRGCFIRRI